MNGTRKAKKKMTEVEIDAIVVAQADDNTK